MEAISKTLIPLFLMLTTPNLVIFVWYVAVFYKGSVADWWSQEASVLQQDALRKMWVQAFPTDRTPLVIVLGYMAFAALLQKMLPGKKFHGPVTEKGNVPVYKDNGFLQACITFVLFLILTYFLKINGASPTVVYDRFGEILCVLTAIGLVFCVFLYFKGLLAPSSSDCGSSGNPVFDFYWGTELYPRIAGVDVKVFTNCRFGLIMWGILPMIHGLKSYELHGFVDSIWVSIAIQLVYVLKFFWWESGYMQTIDISVDRAGYYLCWGCLVFIPGFCLSSTLYMVMNPIRLGPPLTLSFLFAGLLSIGVNYWADYQRQETRRSNGKTKIWGREPEVIVAKYKVATGETKENLLLVSGFWGISRHFHYFPELALNFFWSVPTLFYHIMPFYWFLFLTVLLVHRSYRDDAKCRKKYGVFWEQYCRKVPYKIVPYVF